MTFKHVKFEDSPTMRALEKVAREKGLVKPEALSKKASLVKKADLTPTSNLMENIVKLCTGLREQGLVKDAAELETRYLQYKQAQTLYETSKETGEDLVESAHPEGSHKLVDVDSTEAIVEDILDQHDLIKEVADKKPQAKLSDAGSVIKAIKMIFAEDVSVQLPQNFVSGMWDYTRKLSEMFNTMQFFSWENDTVVAFNRLNAFVNKVAASKVISVGAINRIVQLAGDLKANLGKETVLGMQSTAAKNATFHVNSLINYMEDTVREEVKSLVEQKSKSDVSDVGKQFTSQIESYLGMLKSWAVTVNNDPDNNDADKAEANKWITDRATELNALKEKFNGVQDPTERNQEAPGFLAALNKSTFVKENAQFKKTWIG